MVGIKKAFEESMPYFSLEVCTSAFFQCCRTKVHVPDRAKFWRFSLKSHTLLCTNKKRGGVIYQSISKITSSELCVYPDRPGSPKVREFTGENSLERIHTTSGRQDKSKSSSVTLDMDANPKHKISHFSKALNPNIQSDFTSWFSSTSVGAALTLEESSSMHFVFCKWSLFNAF